MEQRLHPLNSATTPPRKFTYPFNYTPHPLCEEAARELQAYLAGKTEWREEIDGGKMFGVLVVEDGEGRLGFLAAYSGLLAGGNDWRYFVPPVFDCQQPDGYFKTNERKITLLNQRIFRLESDPKFASLRNEFLCAQQRAKEELASYREFMRQEKESRDTKRQSGTPLGEAEKAAMERESQFQKAELKRIRKRLDDGLSALKDKLDAGEEEIKDLKKRRKEMSDSLQSWLFSQYKVRNAKGDELNLHDIFRATVRGVPPSGAGDCCAPKLLQYAYRKGLHPVCMAEFWWGRSPKQEIRHHLHYYPACRSKCAPILGFMLRGLDVDPNPHDTAIETSRLRTIYADDDIIVVSKPSGMLSVKGLVNRESVADVLRREYGEGFYEPAHRLDMDTSGILVVARSEAALRNLREQFADRKVQKRYAAVLETVPQCAPHGFIRLPLAPDLADSPRQKVDYENGKPSVTEYNIGRTDGRRAYVTLRPYTGRTHQLRIHCAHNEGLAAPIVGDKLYGHPSGERLMLHAEYISFCHPVTGKRMTFTDKQKSPLLGLTRDLHPLDNVHAERTK